MWFYITFDFRTPRLFKPISLLRQGMGDLVCVRIFFSQTSGHTTVWDFIPAAITRAEIHNSFFSAGYFFSRYLLARYIFSPEICLKSRIPLPTLHPLQNLPNFGTFQMVGPVVPLGTLPKLSLFPLKNKEWLAPFVSSVVMFWLKNQVIANSPGSIYQDSNIQPRL